MRLRSLKEWLRLTDKAGVAAGAAQALCTQSFDPLGGQTNAPWIYIAMARSLFLEERLRLHGLLWDLAMLSRGPDWLEKPAAYYEELCEWWGVPLPPSEDVQTILRFDLMLSSGEASKWLDQAYEEIEELAPTDREKNVEKIEEWIGSQLKIRKR